MKVLLLGLGGVAVIICALYFVFREPGRPDQGKDAQVKRPAVPANTVTQPKPDETDPKAEPFTKREFTNAYGQRMVLVSEDELELTGRGKTTKGSYTQKGDVLRFSLEGEKEKRVLFDTEYGLINPAKNEKGWFFSRGHESLAAEMQKSIVDRGNITKAESTIGTIVSYVQIYVTKNEGQLPPNLDALLDTDVPSDESLLYDSWGQRYQWAVPAQRSKDQFDVFSSGPNQKPGDDDDIGNWSGKSEAEISMDLSPEAKKFSKVMQALLKRPEAQAAGK